VLAEVRSKIYSFPATLLSAHNYYSDLLIAICSVFST
jgi:hypothetical protein